MARTKTTETSSITAAQLADGDLIPVIDVSDTTMSSTGTNKKLAKSQLAEAAGVTAHLANGTGAHAASAISYAGSTNLSATTVEGALDELDTEKLASATATTLYGTGGPRALNASIAFLGDSLFGATPHGESIPRYATLLSAGRLHYGTNAGVAGNTTAQMLARITDVTSTADGTVVVLGGTNDAAQSVALSTTMSNIASIVAAIRAAGKTPVLCLIPPQVGKRAGVAKINLALSIYALNNNIPLVDLCTPVMDPSTGDYSSGNGSGDGVHPSPAGYALLGQTLATALTSGGVTSPYAMLAARDNSDSTNMLTNPLAINISTDIPTSWGKLASGSGATFSVVTGDTSILGNWAQIALSSAPDYRAIKNGFGTGYSVGDKLLVQGRVTTSGISGSATLGVQVQFYSAAINQIVQAVGVAVTNGVFSKVVTVPSGTTWTELQMLAGKSGVGGSGTFKISQTAIWNLTTLGFEALGLVPVALS